jgi:hypothetical protein
MIRIVMQEHFQYLTDTWNQVGFSYCQSHPTKNDYDRNLQRQIRTNTQTNFQDIRADERKRKSDNKQWNILQHCLLGCNAV